MASDPPTPPTSLEKSIGGKAPNPSFTTKTPQLPFNDHAGNPALMVYSWTVHRDLTPPPHHFSIQVYVTTGLTAATAGLLPTLLLHKLQLAWGELVWLRLDVYFLPAGSSPETCMAHYRAEKEARKNERLHVMSSHAQYASDFANFLIMVERADWGAGDGVLSTVRFDPPEEYLTHPDEGLRISQKVLYEEGVPILQPKNWRDWIMANPSKTPVGAKCGELHHACRNREEYKERYVEEVEKMEEERGRG